MDAPVAAVPPNLDAPAVSPPLGNSTPSNSTPTSSSGHGEAWGTMPLRPPFDLWLIQVLLIVVLARVLAFLLRKIKQPSVIAEVIAGILLGPSVLGWIPNYINTLFPASSMNALSVTANIFFMFLVGIELDFGLLQKQLKSTLLISAAGILVPFLLSIGVSWLLYNVDHSSSSFLQFVLFLGVAMSITAFPVLARIIKEKHLLHTRVGLTTLSTAAWDDVVAWCLLALVLSIITGDHILNALWTVISLIVYVLLMFFLGRRFFRWMFIRGNHTTVSPMTFTSVIALAMINSWLTDYIGLHSIFGAFVFGVVLPRENRFMVQVAEKLEDIVMAVFLPIYFVFSGLKTQIGLLNDAQAWGLVLLVVIVAAGSKILGGSITARITGMGWRESITLGVMMNTKGLVELIVLNIGYDNHIISAKVFTIMVIMALVTTFITSPLVHFLYPLKRVLEFEAVSNAKQSLLFSVKDRSSVAPFVTLMDLFTRARPKKWKLRALRLVTIIERPSAYMTTDHPDDVLKYAEDSAKLLSLKLKPLSIVYDDTNESRTLHIVSTSRKFNTNYVFFDWDLSPGQDSTRLGGQTIGDTMDMLDCSTAILINRNFQHPLKRLSFIYSGGTVHDYSALKLVRAVAKIHLVEKIRVIIPVIDSESEKDAAETGQPKGSGHNFKDDPVIQKLVKIGGATVEIVEVKSKKSAMTNKVLLELTDGEGQLLIFGCGREAWIQPQEATGVIYHDVAMGCSQTLLVVSKCDGTMANLPDPNDRIIEMSDDTALISEKKKKKQKKQKQKLANEAQEK